MKLNPFRFFLAALALIPLLSFGIARAAATGSAHQSFLEANRDLPPVFASAPGSIPLGKSPVKEREVMGFYPYWVSTPVDELRFDLLTTVAFFSLEMNQYGNFTALHGWPYGELIDEAHSNGARVVITVTNFSSSQIAALVSSTANRQNAIDNILAQIEAGNADGVNIDFEGVAYAAKADFVTFIGELAVALENESTSYHLTVCTPAIDWSSAYDYNLLAESADYLFIMAYDYHWKGGNPGPVAPLFAGGIWESWAGIDYTLNDYETYIAPYTLAKVILGLPLYGYDWPSVDSAVPGTSTGNASAVLYETAQARVEGGQYGPLLYDEFSESPYLIYSSSGAHQHWFDDVDSLSLRFDYASDRNTGGIGFWALGYDGNDPELWDSVSHYLGDDDDDDDDDDDNDDDATDDDDDDSSGRICD